jgi:effector-binding domain-containing protein
MLTMPEMLEREPQRYVAVRLPVMIPFNQQVGELFDAFARAGVSPVGVEFIKYNLVAMPHLEIEVGIITDALIPLSGRLVEGVLPAGRYVRMTYTGPYEGLYDATAMLVGWAKEKGFKWDSRSTEAGELFTARLEVYDNNPSVEPDPSKLITTLLFKLLD